MQIDSESLRRQYESLTDEALLAIEPSELTGLAQNFYDAEMDRRGLKGQQEELEQSDDDKPVWLDEAAEVYSRVDLPWHGASARNGRSPRGLRS